MATATIFVYEYVTGGGTLATGDVPPPSLLDEGRAMLCALASDFAALPHVDVVVLHDARLPAPDLPRVSVRTVHAVEDEGREFERATRTSDWTVVIAPETAGALLARCRLLEQVGGRLAGPSPSVVEIAGDKRKTAARLKQAGVPTPVFLPLPRSEDEVARLPFPVVLKPVDGAGSCDVRRVDTPAQWSGPLDGSMCVARMVAGEPVSVALLCGPRGAVPLPPCRQHLSRDGRMRYLGGELPLAPNAARRAGDLALRAVAALPEPRGYLGVDLVLGTPDDGTGDSVIEINPRLTTSYVGLRAAVEGNLAAAMLDVLQGRDAMIRQRDAEVRFNSRGEVAAVARAGESP